MSKSGEITRRSARLRCVVRIVFVLILALVLAWAMLPVFFDDPMNDLAAQTPVRSFYDAHGQLIRIESTYDYQWRMPVERDQVAQCFVDAILAVEDHNFYGHGGISYGAACRAAWSNLSGRRVVSGASTIAMQLVALPESGRRKTLWMKFIQAQKARRLAQLHSKDEILMEYINRIPCGGKIYGVQAASLYYFNKKADRLTVAEAAMIAGLPQRPNAFRPDRHLERARRRQLMVLQAMEKNGKLKKGDAKVINEEYLALRGNNEVPFFRRFMKEPHFCARAVRENPNSFEIHTSLVPEYQDILLDQLKHRVDALPGVKDGAAVLIDAKTGKVLAMVGTLDFDGPFDGQVNVAIRTRSAGSTLKPFIYAEAIEGGLIAESTVLRDEPFRFSDYAPVNFDGTFIGDVSACDALSKSLNTPAVKLVANLGVERVSDAFEKLRIMSVSKTQAVKMHGLTIALGTAGTTLLNLTAAYAALANGGLLAEKSFLADSPTSNSRIYSPGTAAMVAHMLRTHPMPETTVDLAWKTGTSNGLFDAWCISFTPDLVLGVWFGNKSGRSSSSLVGAKAAVPAAARIMSAIYATRKAVDWPPLEENLKEQQLCRVSGMPPSPDCKDFVQGWVLPGFTMRKCRRCGKDAIPKIEILSPKPQIYLAEGKDTVSIDFKTDFKNAHWYVDNLYIGTLSPNAHLSFTPGVHTAYAIALDGNAVSASVTFTVQK